MLIVGQMFSEMILDCGCCGTFWKLSLIGKVTSLITELTSLFEGTLLTLTNAALHTLGSNAH